MVTGRNGSGRRKDANRQGEPAASSNRVRWVSAAVRRQHLVSLIRTAGERLHVIPGSCAAAVDAMRTAWSVQRDHCIDDAGGHPCRHCAGEPVDPPLDGLASPEAVADEVRRLSAPAVSTEGE